MHMFFLFSEIFIPVDNTDLRIFVTFLWSNPYIDLIKSRIYKGLIFPYSILSKRLPMNWILDTTD